MKTIFINDYGMASNWIMGIIASDITREANLLGYECRCGGLNDYRGEDICYHLSYSQAVPIKEAKHNSVFYTHLNDILQEKNLVSIKDKFDSFICMSPEDAEFLIELGFDKEKVYGRTLATRNTYVKPLTIGIFSACYPDGRKNEQWLIDFCRTEENAKLLNFSFIGKGWGRVVNELESFGCSYEWHNVSRSLPYEYQFQQNKLVALNYYIYMGMDGGAMGTYDAYAQDVPLCVTYDGFHKSIPELDLKFDDYATFMSCLSTIAKKQRDRIDFFASNNAEAYVRWIISVWKGYNKDIITDADKKCLSFSSVVEKKRTQYYKLNLGRLKKYFSLLLYKKRLGK